MLKLFQTFLSKMQNNFRRISRATRNEMEITDLHNDAFVLALEIGDRRGRAIDFSDPADQELVMRAVNVQNVKRGDWKLRRAVRIDHAPDSEDESAKWIERLPAQASSDPLISLLAQESAFNFDARWTGSYSQAKAYAITFNHFKNDRQKVCAYLVVSEGTLGRRVNFAADSVKVQPSIFDKTEQISANFMPLRGIGTSAIIDDGREAEQQPFAF